MIRRTLYFSWFMAVLFSVGCAKETAVTKKAETSKEVTANETGKKEPSTGGKGDKIILISSLPRTGSAEGQTTTMVNGIRLAIDEFGGKIGDFEIEYLDLDDAEASTGQWTSQAEKANAQRAANDPDVMAYIGPYNSGAATNSMPILNKAGLVMISPAATATGLTKKNPDDAAEPKKYRPSGKINFTRVVPSDDMQGPVGAKFVAEVLKKKKVYILDDFERYGQGVANEFERGCKTFGLEVLGHEQINVQQQEFTALMTKIAGIKNGPPDVIYFGGTTQTKGGQLAKDMVKAGLKCDMIGPDGCYEQSFITSAGPEVDGRVYVTFGGKDPTNLKDGPGKEFVDKYKTKYKKQPEAYAVYGYEAAKVILLAIKKVGKKDRSAVLAEVLATKDFDQGAVGKWSFDENGDTTQQIFTVSKISKGQFVPVVELNGRE
jgi:branched-chain amino acid transport system substrate-binding protein